MLYQELILRRGCPNGEGIEGGTPSIAQKGFLSQQLLRSVLPSQRPIIGERNGTYFLLAYNIARSVVTEDCSLRVC